MLTTERIHNPWSLDDIFGQGQWCPFCYGEEFTYLEGHSITCDQCGADFSLRPTAGDPGVVVDARPAETKFRMIHRGELVSEGKTRGDCACWQVLKSCEGGLDDRDHWCTFVAKGGLDLYLRRDEAPLAKEVFRFSPYDVARRLAYELWETETEAGQTVASLRAEGMYELDWPKWIGVYRRKYLYGPDGKIRELTNELKQRYVTGYYLEAQTERIFDDCYFIHLCIPKVGEKPVAVKCGWQNA